MNRKVLAAAEFMAILPATVILMPFMFYAGLGMAFALVGAYRTSRLRKK